MNHKLIFLGCFFFIGITVNAQSISVNDPGDPETNYTAEELIENVLLSGSLECVDIELLNIAQNPAGVTNLSQRSWGYFNSEGTNFPFEEGIILSSGFATSAEGPNDTSGSSDAGGGFPDSWVGDTDLQTLLNNEYGTSVSTNNATVLEFSFTSQLDEVAFDFIFASEEYEDDFECSDNYRDGFAFLISGPGIADNSGAPFGGANIASVPNSDNVPVSTASIHTEDMALCGFEIQNQNFFPLYYVSNFGANNSNSFQFDGRTISLTARATIIPGETYTMKMVIADRGDSSFDSAVFLKAGSFDIGDVDLGADILLESGNANCEGETITLQSGNQVADATYIWYKDGVEIEGETETSLDVTTTGTYMVEVYYSSTCMAQDEVLIEFFPNPEIELGADSPICPEEPILLDATPINQNELTNISYTWFVDGVEQPETTSTFEATTGGVYSVEVSGNQCIVTDEVVFDLVDFTVDLGDPISPCGVDSFEIVPNISWPVITGATYMWSTGEQTPTITVTQNGDYWVDVTINGCTVRGQANVTFRERPVINLGEDFFKCGSETVQLNATPTNVSQNLTYTWSLNGTELTGAGFSGASIDILEEGTYTVSVNNNECIGTDEIVVTNYEVENCIIPEGISPNSDNINDCMDLQFLSDELGIESLQVFNRHGRLVYEKSDYVNEFCGQDQDGNDLPTGTYYYVLKLNNSNQVYNQIETGWVYINRQN
ncbi:MAG TPA: choice-of-anchor L domain-containing protein [Salinimicrobium sp.]|nr:choice-of-anchor L domain-containing protein [Salinimicrobium sp.]